MRFRRFVLLEKEIITTCDDLDVPYLIRWTLFRCPLFGILLHKFLRSDHDDPHNHPWSFVSIILKGGYNEEVFTPPRSPTGDIFLWSSGASSVRYEHRPLKFLFRRADHIHRVTLRRYLVINEHGDALLSDDYVPSWSLLLHGPKKKEWGFWTRHGFVHFREFFARITRCVTDLMP